MKAEKTDYCEQTYAQIGYEKHAANYISAFVIVVLTNISCISTQLCSNT